MYSTLSGAACFWSLPQTPKTLCFTMSGAPGPSGARPGASQAPQLARKNPVVYSVWAPLAPGNSPRGPTVALQGPATTPRGPQQPHRALAGRCSGPAWSRKPRILQSLGLPWPRGPLPDPQKTLYFYNAWAAPGPRDPSRAPLWPCKAPRQPQVARGRPCWAAQQPGREPKALYITMRATSLAPRPSPRPAKTWYFSVSGAPAPSGRAPWRLG